MGGSAAFRRPRHTLTGDLHACRAGDPPVSRLPRRPQHAGEPARRPAPRTRFAACTRSSMPSSPTRQVWCPDARSSRPGWSSTTSTASCGDAPCRRSTPACTSTTPVSRRGSSTPGRPCCSTGPPPWPPSRRCARPKAPAARGGPVRSSSPWARSAGSPAAPGSVSSARPTCTSGPCGTWVRPASGTRKRCSTSPRRHGRTSPRWASWRAPCRVDGRPPAACSPRSTRGSGSPVERGCRAFSSTLPTAPARCSSTATSTGSSDGTGCRAPDVRSATASGPASSTGTSSTTSDSSWSSTADCSMTPRPSGTPTSTATS